MPIPSCKNISRPQYKIETALRGLHRWVRSNGWTGYDPYDVEHWAVGLPKFVRDLRIFGKHPVGVLLGLAGRHPRFTRRILGVPQRIYPKAIGLFAASYASMYEQFGDDEYLSLAEQCAQWLLDNVSPGYKGFGWGLPIDWRSGILIPAGTPCVTVSVICGEGFWRLYEATGQAEYLEACRNICESIAKDLNMHSFDANTLCFSYTPLDNFRVHNANLMAAAFLVKIGREVGCKSYVDLGLRAGNYALDEQRPDGSLSYWGSDRNGEFRSDHYHSGFDIRALHSLWKSTARQEYLTATQRYYEYYNRTFFGPDGAAWRNPGDPTLIDIHGCAEALICNAQLIKDFPEAAGLLAKSVRWTIENMQSPRGYFIYRMTARNGRRRRLDIPFVRWGQAWMMRGLTAALEALKTAIPAVPPAQVRLIPT